MNHKVYFDYIQCGLPGAAPVPTAAPPAALAARQAQLLRDADRGRGRRPRGGSRRLGRVAGDVVRALHEQDPGHHLDEQLPDPGGHAVGRRAPKQGIFRVQVNLL